MRPWAYQTKDVLDAMTSDSGVALAELRVDGGMTENELLMQFQADLLGVDVVLPVVAETTALGAAFAAGLAVGFWDNLEEIRSMWAESRRWEPAMDDLEQLLRGTPGNRRAQRLLAQLRNG